MAPPQQRQHLGGSPLGFRGGLPVLERVPKIRSGSLQLFPSVGQGAEREQPLAQVVDQADLETQPP